MLMLFQLAPLFLTNILAVILLFVVLVAHRVHRSVRISLAVTILSLLLWQDIIFIIDNTAVDQLLWNTLVFIWPTIAVMACFSFIRYLHRAQAKVVYHSKLTRWVAIFSLVQLISIFSFTIFTAITITADGVEFQRGFGYYVYIVSLVVTIGLLIAEVIARLSQSQNRSQERKAMNVVLTTIVAAAVYGVFVNALIPVLTKNQSLINLGVFVIDIFAVGLWLSIAKGKLLDIRFYAIRSVAYGMTLATLLVTYALIAFFLSRWILGFEQSSVQGLINISLALLLALIFQPVKQFFDQLTNKIFYRDVYDKDEFYTVLSKTLTSTNDLRQLLKKAASVIAETLKAEQSLFYVRYDHDEYISAGTSRHSKLPLSDVVALTQFLDATNASAIITESLDQDEPIRRLLMSHRIEIALPLRIEAPYVSFLFLGEQKTSGYTTRDIKTIQSISDEIIIGIRNALSLQELKELNETLQQRIESATHELRASNRQLQRLDEAKDEFISMASHQLRTPLTSIKGYISMIADGDVGKISEQQKKLLEEAFMSSERMVRLINDFLNVSRLQTGKFVIEKRPVDLAKIVQQEIASLEQNARAHDMKFSVTVPKKMPLLDLDENKIRQVIMNFADNAIYYSKEKSTIKVELRLDERDVYFTVKDTGIGVPVAEQAHLFGKFFRATNARQQRPDGTGVGLYLAKRVVSEHHGDVLFESKEGKGSTFGFRLPLGMLQPAATDAN